MNKYFIYIYTYTHTTKRCKRDTKQVKGESYDVSREDSIIKIIIILDFDKIILKLKLKRNKNSKTNFLCNAHVC